MKLYPHLLLLLTAASLYAAEPKTATREELEAQFKTTMTNATMAGRAIPLKEGVLGAGKDDSYSIVSVEKQAGDVWIINARMRNAVVPVPVHVQWAGDTAVIIVDNLQMPGNYGGGGNAYSARVLIHEHTYAGTWSGDDHGGLISGVIKNR
jgi:hypothetical protein